MSSSPSDNTHYNAALYLCSLICCALDTELTPPPHPDGVSLKQVYKLACHNSVEGISYYGVIKRDFPNNAELLQKWKNSLNRVIFRTALFDVERENIFPEMRKKRTFVYSS